jgi:hypothetical protein
MNDVTKLGEVVISLVYQQLFPYICNYIIHSIHKVFHVKLQYEKAFIEKLSLSF